MENKDFSMKISEQTKRVRGRLIALEAEVSHLNYLAARLKHDFAIMMEAWELKRDPEDFEISLHRCIEILQEKTCETT